MGVFLLPTPDGRGGAARRLPGLRRPAAGRGSTARPASRPWSPPSTGHSLDTLSSVADTLPPSVFVSRRTGEVIAARFTGDRPRVVPLDPHFAEVQAALEELSDGVLDAVSSDLDEQRWIATFVHDREPTGSTWFYDHATGESRLLFRRRPAPGPGGPRADDPGRVPGPRRPAAARVPDPARRGRARRACRWSCWCTAGRGCTTPGATTRPCSSSPTAATPCSA